MISSKKVYLALFLLIILTLYITILNAGRDIPPPDTSDLTVDRPEVAEKDNAFTYFNQIHNTIYQPATNRMIISEYKRDLEVDLDQVKEILDRNSTAFSLIELGVKCSICLVPEVTDFSAMPYLQDWLTISKLMPASIKYDLNTGNYSNAVRTCTTMLKFSDLTLHDSETLIQMLVSIAIMPNALNNTREIALDENTSIQSLEKLARALDNLQPIQTGFIRSFKTEYQFFAHSIDEIRDGNLNPLDITGTGPSALGQRAANLAANIGYLFQPEKTKLMFADSYRIIIKNTKLCYKDMIPLSDIGHSGNYFDLIRHPNAYGNVMYQELIPAISGILKKKSAVECNISATKLTIACIRYKRSHGRFPESLSALIPEYINAVPSDPYDGKPFRYNPDRKIIYAIGINLIDEGGSTNIINKTKFHHRLFNEEDAVFPLTRPHPKEVSKLKCLKSGRISNIQQPERSGDRRSQRMPNN